jgi:hypothetical protein
MKMQAYSRKEDENDPGKLSDVEIFYHDGIPWDDDEEELEAGYYYQYCFPGCLPESDPIGPFNTENEAFDAMREENEY